MMQSPTNSNHPSCEETVPSAGTASSPESHASASPETAAGGPSSYRRPDRSCNLCHRRKIRCDRQLPCLACVRARLTCTYPSGERPPRRVRKATIADVASRISDLEKTIVAAAAIEGNTSAPRRVITQQPLPPVPVPLPLSPHGSPSELKEISSEEILVRNGSSSQYFNELLISRVIEEDQDKSSLLYTPPEINKPPNGDSPYSLMGLLSSPSAFPDSSTDWQIPKMGAMQLWQAFVQYVDPVFKVLHIPTDEVVIFSAIYQPEKASLDVIALVSAIYFAGIMTLEPHEVQLALGIDQGTALNFFKMQYHRTLAQADVLENPTVILLQSLAIYLGMVRAYNHGRGIWILQGLAIRMAISIGLHRDGSKLGLPPFEAEVRRRLWWHFLTRESRSSEDHGISSWPTIPAYDTQLPLNIDDSELRPDMDKLPPPHLGWTRISLHLVCMEIAQALQNIAYLSANPYATAKEVARTKMFTDLRARVEQYVKPCNPVIPMQKMTGQTALAMVYKIDFVTRQQLASIDNPDKRNSFATEENLISACDGLEIHIELWEDELLRPFRWCFRGHPQYHLLLYVLWHLCVSPQGPSIPRAWVVVEKMFEMERVRHEDALSNGTIKTVVLTRLKKKADLIRQSIEARNLSMTSTGQDQMVMDQQSNMGNQTSTPPQGMMDGRRFDAENLDWSNLTQNVPDWNTLVEDLHVDLHDFSSYF